VEDGTTSEANLQSAEAASAKMEEREELLEETAANNEGMPEAESGEVQRRDGGRVRADLTQRSQRSEHRVHGGEEEKADSSLRSDDNTWVARW